MNNAKKIISLLLVGLVLVAVIINPGCMSTKLTGWVEADGELRYYNDQGVMVTGWLFRDDGTYYLLSDGTRATGWQEIGGQNYFFSDDGVMHTGWLEEADGKRLLGTDGAQIFGLTTYNDRIYYLDENGLAATGWQDIDGHTYYMNENGVAATGLTAIGETTYAFDTQGVLATGWYEWDGVTYCIGEDGIPLTGWQEVSEKTYYLAEDGSVYNGWLEDEGHTYYFEDGDYVTGIITIDDQKYFFDSRGWNLLMVNPWNYVPENYEPVLADIGGDHYLAREAHSDFVAMIAACKKDGLAPIITSSYRTMAKQEYLFNNKVDDYLAQGYSEEDAKAKAGTSVAIPGTSEHQLGLAVDITDNAYRKLDKGQEETPTQKWLIENSWKYGFILRYPNGKSEITGIIYEPWHYRYVGRTLAAEIYELDLTLEEYLEMLTEQENQD